VSGSAVVVGAGIGGMAAAAASASSTACSETIASADRSDLNF
jgi:threonine dehydrogenase-like Zn-dependent dehydrogenase